MKKIFLSVIVTFLFTINMFGQESTFAIHINPLVLFQKAVIKVEYRTKQMGFLATAFQKYGSITLFPGTQLGFECRYYINPDYLKRRENFWYSKVISGYQQYSEDYIVDAASGYYYGVGAGFGNHFNFNHFFIDINAGLKYVLSTVKQEDLFYATGPGSIVDLHFTFGYQF